MFFLQHTLDCFEKTEDCFTSSVRGKNIVLSKQTEVCFFFNTHPVLVELLSHAWLCVLVIDEMCYSNLCDFIGLVHYWIVDI